MILRNGRNFKGGVIGLLWGGFVLGFWENVDNVVCFYINGYVEK